MISTLKNLFICSKNKSVEEWKTIVIEKIELRMPRSKYEKQQWLFTFYYKNFSLPTKLIHDYIYELPETTLGRFVTKDYQYDVHLRLNSHEPHEIISIHKGRTPRHAILILFLPFDLTSLVLDFICTK